MTIIVDVIYFHGYMNLFKFIPYKIVRFKLYFSFKYI